ncbi:MAG: hypothetical protein HYT87_13170 [Nitrospirae bacterium]|nr:hypothetical protein [Nitrospirota bacterium]
MSAYIVSPHEINYLVQSAGLLATQQPPLTWVWDVNRSNGCVKSGTLHPGDRAAQERIGQLLQVENLRSVEYRYSQIEPHKPEEYTPTPITLKENPVQVIKSCHYYEYQSCEHPGWETSEACAFIQALEKAAMRALPGYKSAIWGAPTASQ